MYLPMIKTPLMVLRLCAALTLTGCFAPKTPEEELSRFIEKTIPTIDQTTPEAAFRSFVALAQYETNLDILSKAVTGLQGRNPWQDFFAGNAFAVIDRENTENIWLVNYSGVLEKVLMDGESQKRYAFSITNTTVFPSDWTQELDEFDEERRKKGERGVVTLDKINGIWTLSAMAVYQKDYSDPEFRDKLVDLVPVPASKVRGEGPYVSLGNFL